MMDRKRWTVGTGFQVVGTLKINSIHASSQQLASSFCTDFWIVSYIKRRKSQYLPINRYHRLNCSKTSFGTYNFSTSCIDVGTMPWLAGFRRTPRSFSSSKYVLNHSLKSLSLPFCSAACSDQKPHDEGVLEFLGYTRIVGTCVDMSSAESSHCIFQSIQTGLVHYFAPTSRPSIYTARSLFPSCIITDRDTGTYERNGETNIP